MTEDPNKALREAIAYMTGDSPGTASKTADAIDRLLEAAREHLRLLDNTLQTGNAGAMTDHEILKVFNRYGVYMPYDGIPSKNITALIEAGRELSRAVSAPSVPSFDVEVVREAAYAKCNTWLVDCADCYTNGWKNGVDAALAELSKGTQGKVIDWQKVRAYISPYALETEWSGNGPWKLKFNSSCRDGHGYELAQKAIREIDAAHKEGEG